MPLDPDIEALLPTLNASDLLQASVADARETFKANVVRSRRGVEPPEVAAIDEIDVDGAAGPLAARVYRPAGPAPHPTLVFFHGGGFVIGDLETHDFQCRRLCRDSEVVVVSVAYRLAPESPFPAGVSDAIAATRWAARNVATLGGDRARLAVGGDSAGGNLAAVAAQAVRGDEPPLAGQLLIYPVCDFANEYPSAVENATGYYLTAEDMGWFDERYLREPADRRDPRASPLLAADLSGVAPAIVFTAEYDPLRDEGEAYADALAAAGVPTVKRRGAGLIHGFVGLAALSAGAARATRELTDELRRLLA